MTSTVDVRDINITETEGHAMTRFLAKARTEGVRLGRDA
jgi:hypothetical protein